MRLRRQDSTLSRYRWLLVAVGLACVFLLATWTKTSSSTDLQSSGGLRSVDVPREEETHVHDDNAAVTFRTIEPKENTKPNRLYCMVPSMYNRKRMRLWTAILKSWGRHCDVIKFFVDPVEGGSIPTTYQVEGSDKVASIVVVDMVRKSGGICSDGMPCRHIWEKVWRSWVYVGEHDLDTADYFMKVDDDSYFIPSNLRQYVRNKGWNPDDIHYFGHYVYMDKVDLISGVLTSFSRGVVRAMVPLYNSMDHEYGPRNNFKHGRCVDRDGATEEKTTSICLNSIGINAEVTIDELNREYVMPLGIPFTLTYKRKKTSTSWYWHKKPWDRGDKQMCCSPAAWGIHGYKSSSRLLEMHEMMEVWPMEKVKHKMLSYPEDDDEHWHMWYIIELRMNILKDLPNQIARGDSISELYKKEYKLYILKKTE